MTEVLMSEIEIEGEKETELDSTDGVITDSDWFNGNSLN